MGRNEIRLRRQRTTARGIDRFRNYNTVLQRYEQTQRLKKVVKVFGFFVVILIVIMIIIFLSRWENSSERTNSQETSKVVVATADEKVTMTFSVISRPSSEGLLPLG